MISIWGENDMNRAERRARGIKKKEPTLSVRACDIEHMKKEAVKDASSFAFKLMLAIPVMVLHDNYGKLNRLSIEGKSREEIFADMCLDLYDSFDKGYVSMDDLMNCLKEETGMSFEEIRK